MRVVQVLFPQCKCPVTFNAQELEFEDGATLVVEGSRGPVLATAISSPVDAQSDTLAKDIPKVLRTASLTDLENREQHSAKEKGAQEMCLERIVARNLQMKLVKAEYLFDGSKAIFYFTADGRIDFRELVRDLARELKTRIEMVQIGVRDEAKMAGGLGICGREFCCSTFLDSFVPVSIKMAKDQSLSLNPTKVSGVCGRLMCCLAFEHGTYVSFKQGLPKLGKRCICPSGPGKVNRYDIVKQKVIILLEDGREVEVDRDDITKLPPQP